MKTGDRYERKGFVYTIVDYDEKTLIQFENAWTPLVLYTPEEGDLTFVCSIVEFERKFCPLDEPIRYDGLYRPAKALDGKRFNVVRYVDHDAAYTGDSSSGIERQVAGRKGVPNVWPTYEAAKAIADKLNAGFKK